MGTPKDPSKQIRNVPPPPVRPKSKGVRSLVADKKEEIYLLQGVTRIACRINVEGEPCTEDGGSVLDPYNLDEDGNPTISGKYGWPDEDFNPKEDSYAEFDVPAWYPGNFAVLLRPMTDDDNTRFFEETNETFKQRLNKIWYVQGNNLRAARGEKEPDGTDVLPLFPDTSGSIEIPILGTMYGDVESNVAHLAACVLAYGGRLVPSGNKKGWETMEVEPKVVSKHLKLGFLDMEVVEGVPAYVEIMTVSGLIDFDQTLANLKADGEIEPAQEDDLKNSRPVSETA